MTSAVLLFISALALPTALARHSAEGAAAAPQTAPPPFLTSRSTPFRRRRVTRSRARTRMRPRVPTTPSGWRARAHAARVGAMGRRARGVRARPGAGAENVRLALPRRARAAAPRAARRRGGAARAGVDDLAGLPASAGEARRSAPRSGEYRAKPAAVRCLAPRSGSRRPAAELGLGRIAAAEGHHEAAVAHLQRAVSLFPEWGAAHYALALSYRALGRRDDAQRALERHAQYGPRWPALEDPVLATVTR